MANEVIGIEVQVKLEQLRSQLATLGPGMEKEAKAMTAALNREIKQQTAAMKAASNATSQVRTDSIKEVAEASEAAGTKFDKLAKAAGPLGGVLARISPEAGAVASSLAGLTGAAEGVAAGLGTSMAGGVAALSAVIGPAVIALGLLAANMQYEAAQAEASKAAHDALNDAIKYTKELASGTADAMLDLKVKVGQIAPEEAAFEKALKGVTAEYEKQDAAIEQAIEARKAAGGAWGAEVKALRDSQEESKRLRDERVLLLAADKEWSAEVRKSAEFVAERDKKAAAAAAAGAAASRKAAELAKETAKEEAELAAEADAAAARATERDLAHMRDLDEHRAKFAVKEQKRTEEAAKQAKADTDAEIKRIADESAARTAALQTDLSTAASVAGSIIGVWDQLNQQKLDGIDTSTRDGKKAAMKQWEENKAAALAMATIQAALAIAMAVASAPPPFNIPAVVMNTVAGAAAVTSIAAASPPAFAAGGFVNAAATGSPAVLHPNEAVLNAQGRQALGDDTIREANAGIASGGEMRVVQVYKHRSFDYFIADNLRTDGPLGRSVRRGDRVGQLRRGRA